MKTLFDDFNRQLENCGFKARKGQIIGASFVDAPRQRNSREENQQIKAGETPQGFQDNPNTSAWKDTQSRWARKNQAIHFGYKNHASVDNQHKRIRDYDVTSAEVHDSQVLVDILADNTSERRLGR